MELGWLTILPPVIAVGMALTLRSVLPALLLGVWSGAWLLRGDGLTGLALSLLDVFEVWVLGALSDPDRLSIILFSFMIGGTVGIISRNGGMQAIVERVVRFASSRRRGQLATGALGMVVFFDDFANTLVVGNSMRPVADRLGISRAKLAFLVDATAAPVAAIALVSSWVGYEVGLLRGAFENLEGMTVSPYSAFIQSIAYSFYPILMLFFVFAVAGTGRDFGPMLRAERQPARMAETDDDAGRDDEGETFPKSGIPHRSLNALLPILVLVGGVIVGILATGEGSSFGEIFGSGNSYKGLMWASFAATLTAAALSVGQRLLGLEEVVEAWYRGARQMFFAMIILVMAWSLGSVIEELETSAFLVSVLGDSLSPVLLPALIFILSAGVAFGTGSSWGTMGIVLPLAVPLAWSLLGGAAGAAADSPILYSTIAGVLTGAVWGDHCSPISDTTILSSMASGCDHLEHVATQLPYALVVGTVAVLFGSVPTALGVPWWLAHPIAMGVLWLVLRFVGRPVEA